METTTWGDPNPQQFHDKTFIDLGRAEYPLEQ